MVLTDNEKRELALEVLRLLREQSIGVNELPATDTMDDVGSLPAYKTKDGVVTAVVVPIRLLGKPAIDAAAVAQEVIELARQTIAETEVAINAVDQSKQEASEAATTALSAAESVDKVKTAAVEATEQAKKATASAIRASDDADAVSSAVSEEWSGLKNEITVSTEAAEAGASLAEKAVQKVNDFLAESEGKLITDEEREKLLNTYNKSETYNRPEIDGKNQATLNEARGYVTTQIAEMIGGAPEALDTLFEISAALGNDPNFATTIMALLNGKADTGHKHTKSQITDFPVSMPASDVHSWAKQSAKPSYTPSEVGAAAADHNHDSAYQPKGNYAAASHTHDYAAKSHSHTADQISDTGTKVMMLQSERSKLAGIEPSNYVSITDNRLTNSRPANGGNADTLGGVAASNFARRDAANTFSGYCTFLVGAGKSSDMRFKIVTGKITNALNIIRLLDVFKYRWDKKNEEYNSIGVSAQQVRKYFPELVTEANDKDKTLSVDYNGLIPVCMQAIKELALRVEEVENKEK